MNVSEIRDRFAPDVKGLTLDAHGNHYGVTPSGGSTYTSPCNSGCGTVFKFNLASGKLTALYNFTGQANGAEPIAPPPVQAGALYGSAIEAGAISRIRPAAR